MLAGLASGLLGVGGGFLIVPLQTLWAGTDQHRATGTSLAAILPIAMVGAGTYYFASGAPQADLPLAASLVVGGAAGVIGGALAAQKISERVLRGFVAILLFGVGLKDVRDAAFGAVAAAPTASPAALGGEQYLLVGVCGLGIGILSGLAGLGGGVFIVPLLVIGFGVPQRIAQGTSLIAILPTAAVGAIIHEANGEVDVRAAAAIAAAGVPAAIVGALLALVVPQRTLLALFGLFLLFAAVRTWPWSGVIRRA
ncbi:MAG: sulfite exporter TauE/SafE family protein [Chloroflexi bacterium]|nr:MAG: sulfite exporter TauE/SafE family protein [Chloroflexota bacterium]